MNCLPPRKNKRKRKRSEDIELTKASGKWTAVDIDTDLVFSNGASVDGFLGLEELNDYDEEAIRSLSDAHRKKKRKKKKNEEGCEEMKEKGEDKIISILNRNFESVVDDGDNKISNVGDKKVVDNGDKTQGKEISGSVQSVTSTDATGDEKGLNEAFIKKPSKRERRKEARKLSFKMKLKERRKKLKEMKRATKPEEDEENTMPEVNVNKMCETVLKASESFDTRANVRNTMSDWLGLGVPDEVLQALADCKFTTPTQIQKETLPQAILCRKDVIGAAETGSGKTLAFGIPLIKIILDMKAKFPQQDEEKDSEEDTPMYALIISPTRELAIQITQHIQTAAKYTKIQCVSIVGGLATAKQERLLTKCPEIVVGTPGRLHKLMTDGCEHLNKINTLKLLVIDEADRMLEHGHFKELNDILDIINRVHVKRQIFVFSATLTLPQHHKNFRQKLKKNAGGMTDETQMLMDKVGLNAKAEIIDLTPKHVTAAQLQQLRVLCTDEEKIIYMVYFLLHHPGRSVIFVNSIALTRRLCSLLALLNFTPLPLHAGKQQRQRLKYLERFTENENGLLIATDVAARGLDIPNVCNVIHFQLPKDPKVYIHRSGRTARAHASGVSLILQGPEDFPALKKVTNVLKLGKDIPCLNVDRKVIEGIKARVVLAKEIDKEEHKYRKENADATWLRKSAAAMEMETDEVEQNSLTKSEKARLNAKRRQLNTLLSQDLRPSGFSGSYITQSGSLLHTSLKMCKT